MLLSTSCNHISPMVANNIHVCRSFNLHWARAVNCLVKGQPHEKHFDSSEV